MDFVGKNAIDFVGKNPSLGNAYTTKNMQAIVSYRYHLQIVQAKTMDKITEVLPTNLVGKCLYTHYSVCKWLATIGSTY